MNETISITDILLTVSVGCNLWFLFLLLYERIMDTRIVRPQRPQRTSSARAVSGWLQPGQPLPYRRNKPPLRKKALSCRRKTLLLTTETRKPPHRQRKSRRKNSMKHSRAYRRRNWSSARMNRRRTLRIHHRLRATALTRLTMPARPPRTRTRHRRNVKRRQRCSPTWKARSCTIK